MNETQYWRAEIAGRREAVRMAKENLSAEVVKSEELRRSWQSAGAPSGDPLRATLPMAELFTAMQDAMLHIDERRSKLEQALHDLQETEMALRDYRI